MFQCVAVFFCYVAPQTMQRRTIGCVVVMAQPGVNAFICVYSFFWTEEVIYKPQKKKLKSNLYVIMEPCRKSWRLQGLEPEISTSTFRCFCLLDGDTCSTTATLLPCCKQFIHNVCQQHWIRASHNHCAMCRQRMPRQTRIPFPDPDMTVPQVLERLSRLLATQALREELNEASAPFFSGI